MPTTMPFWSGSDHAGARQATEDWPRADDGKPITLDPVDYAVISQALIAIAREMGTKLIRSSYSNIVREAQDASAALFDAAGNVVAQAELIPMHLGSMSEIFLACVAAVPDRQAASPAISTSTTIPTAAASTFRTCSSSRRSSSTAGSSPSPARWRTISISAAAIPA